MNKLDTLDFRILKNIPFKSIYDYHIKEVVKYANIPFAFDIETTSTDTKQGDKFAFMYEFTFGFCINDKNYIFYGRNWRQFLDLCKNLQQVLGLNDEKRIIIYVHNLSFEFQFMRKYFEWISVFATDDRTPIKALNCYGIEFRDSYILSGYSLAKLADNLTSHSIKKLVGDLNYSLIRTEKTYLTSEELAYMNNDVEIILDYISEQIQQYNNDITKIPLTNTGRVRTFVRNNCLHSNKSHKKDSKGKRSRYRELMLECVLNSTTYLMLKRCFMGGFTHASLQYSGKILENVHSIDFTSSYPAVMLSEKFPMSKPIKVNLKNENFDKLLDNDNIGLMFDIKIIGLQSKNTFETYISDSKCYNLKNPIINNGRVFSADELTTTITDIDYKIIKGCYHCKSISISNCYKFYMDYLPKSVLLSILDLYGKKTTLKGVKGKETEYLVSKGMLNSVYGMCVTDIVRGEINYTDSDEWIKTGVTEDLIDEQIEKYNTSKNRFLYYPWGVWVTAYARKNLWSGIFAINNDYIYSDTDSIKFLNYEKHKSYIDKYNKEIEFKLQKMCNYRHIDFNLCKPHTIKGITKLIGVWDYEGCYDRFKTLGAKRYIVQQGNEINITIAGLSKNNGAKYMMKQCNGDIIKVFKMFNNNLYIPSYATGKNTHIYIDNEITETITDYNGVTSEVSAKSGVHLSPCDFTLSISKEYGEFLKMFNDGYLFKGVKYE